MVLAMADPVSISGDELGPEGIAKGIALAQARNGTDSGTLAKARAPADSVPYKLLKQTHPDYDGTYWAFNPLTGQWGYPSENGSQGSVVPGEAGIGIGVERIESNRPLVARQAARHAAGRKLQRVMTAFQTSVMRVLIISPAPNQRPSGRRAQSHFQ